MTSPVTVTAEASALKHRNSPPDYRWPIRQWQAPTRGSCSPATVIFTAPQRQWPVIAELEGLPRGDRLGSKVVGCTFTAPEVDVGHGQPARRGRWRRRGAHQARRVANCRSAPCGPSRARPTWGFGCSA